MAGIDGLVTVTEAGEMLGVTRERVQQFIAEGRLRVVARVGRSGAGGHGLILLRETEVERFGRIERPIGHPPGQGRRRRR